MTPLAIIAVLIGIGVCAYAAIFGYANRHVRPTIGPISPSSGPQDLPDSSSTLSVLTWNIGYAGLGKNADLIVDNGRSLRALRASEIANAAQGIADWLALRSSDVICLQENADAGFLTRKVPLRSIIETALGDRQNVYWTDMKSVFVPPFLRLNHGMSVHTRLNLRGCRAEALHQDDTYHLGVLKKHYGALISRIGAAYGGHDWVVINIHLSAFDVQGQARLNQLQDLMLLAQQDYDAGHFVVVAGDWNMRLTPTDFAHQTEEKNLFWLTDFPHEVLPDGWNIAVDRNTPTVRSLNAPYVPRKSYTTIIDGFIFSPNVALKRVSAADLGFELSDHHPVEAEFVARP